MLSHEKAAPWWMRLGPLVEVIVVLGVALVYGAMIVRSAEFTVALTGGILVFLFFSRSPLKALCLLLIVVPFSQMPIFNDSVASFPGARPFLLLGGMTMAIAVINFDRTQPMPKLTSLIALAIFVLWAVGLVRALEYREIINIATEQDYSTVGFILSFFIKPLVYFVPLIIVSKFLRDEADVDVLVRTIVWAILLISAYFLYQYFFGAGHRVNIKGDVDWTFVGDILSQHKNEAAALHTVCFPILVARFFAKKDKIALIGILMSIAAVALMYSRTAYVTVGLAIPMYLVISKRFKLLPLVFLGGALMLVVLADSVTEMAMKGMEEGDIREVTSGRIGGPQWGPLIDEFTNHPEILVYGLGRNGVYATDAYQKALFAGTNHPHNMYLEMVIDTGFLGLFIIMGLYAAFLMQVYRSIGYVRDPVLKEYQYGVLVASVCYLAGGFTRGTIFPTNENSFFWAILAMALFIASKAMAPARTTLVGKSESGDLPLKQ